MKIKRVLIFLSALIFLACGGAGESPPQPGGPADTLRRYLEASQKGDIETMKRLLSKESLELIEHAAEDQRTTVDEILRRETAIKIEKIPEMRNEQIQGDTATVEVRDDRTGQFDMKVPFVREAGEWKFARDKYIQQLMDKLRQDMNRPPVSPAASNGNAGPDRDAANTAANK